MNLRVIETGDGSISLFDDKLKESYHSVYGAETESLHVFIKNGLEHLYESKPVVIKILEVGLGTGLNALLTLEWLRNHPGTQIIYTALEPFPPSNSFLEIIGNSFPETRRSDFMRIHTSDWDTFVEIESGFVLRKLQISISAYRQDEQFNLVYYDAFGPPVQPEMWTESIFKNLTEMMETGGVWVSYCAKGEVRRILKNCGMKVERLAGPPKKREMLRATR
ncbi:MAG: tRNA (5-methylaminomethyl-2-thiouridine)(34)-methyltransferase MnmD [Bacteroidetes bacterium]|nr:tRNA (5-methylaminomethyl-2-thiouridine)(34)-methyltransferase MnmD [Bacteroidota bacterium]